MYTVFGCFMDMFFHSCCGFSIHSCHSLNGSVREETMVYHERCNQQQISEPRLYTGQRNIWRIPSMMHHHWEIKCYIMLASKRYLCRWENGGFQSGVSFLETRIYWWFLEAEPASFGSCVPAEKFLSIFQELLFIQEVISLSLFLFLMPFHFKGNSEESFIFVLDV